MRRLLFVLVLILLSAGSSFATTIFSDDFNAENGGVGVLNYSSFANWTVTDGTVDLIGNGFWQLGIPESYGLFVDLDGSTNNAGVMATSSAFTLMANTTYLFSFDLAGNQRTTTAETVSVTASLTGNGFGWIFGDYSLNRYDPFQTFSFMHTVGSNNELVNLSFAAAGGDNIGMLLDNVRIETAPVPEPSTWLLLGTGLAGLAFYRRKKS